MPVGEEDEKRNGSGCCLEGELSEWVLCLEAGISLLQGESLEGFSRLD